MKFILIFCIIFYFFFSCNPPAKFNEPQPPETENLAKFPKFIFGQYLSVDSNSILEITENTIIRIYNYDEMFHVNELDSNQRISVEHNDSTTNHQIIIKYKTNDSVLINFNETDTLFNISETNILRKLQNDYFINTLDDERENWVVKKINLSKEQLTLSNISEYDVQQLQGLEAVEVQKDSTSHVFSLKKKQFKKFVKRGGFRSTEIFIKQKKIKM